MAVEGSWWSHPDGATGHGPGFRLPPGRVAAGQAPAGQAAAGHGVSQAADQALGPVEPPRAEAGHRFRPAARIAVGAVLVVICAGLLGGGVGAVVQGTRQGGRITLHPVNDGRVKRDPGSTAAIVRAVLPGVVYLRIGVGGSDSTGTGIVLDGAGHILTNNHVIAPQGQPGRVTVTFSSGQEHPATLVGRDVDSDLAVIQVKGVAGLHPLALGSADRLQVGDPVVAIGAPFGLRGTVTSGIVSARDRPLTSGGTNSGAGLAYLDALQTDAPINPGNSGGPLLDAAGTVVGINTAIRSADSDSSDPFGAQDQAGSIGLGFAIPVDQALRIAEQLINTGRAVHTVVGVTLDLTYQGGARILDALAGDAALKPGDIVTAVDGTPVTSGDDLVALIRGRRPGDTTVLSVQRDGTSLEVPELLRSTPKAGLADSA